MIERCFAARPAACKAWISKFLAEESSAASSASDIPNGRKIGCPRLPNPGEFHWRAEGERHAWDPQSIADLQVAARDQRSRTLIGGLPSASTATTRTRCTLRGLLQIQRHGQWRPDSARRSRAGQGHRQAVLHRRDELRLHFGGSP